MLTRQPLFIKVFGFIALWLFTGIALTPSFGQDSPKALSFKGSVKIFLKKGVIITGDAASYQTTAAKTFVSAITGNAFFCNGYDAVTADQINTENAVTFSATGNVRIKYRQGFAEADSIRGNIQHAHYVLNSNPPRQVKLISFPVETTQANFPAITDQNQLETRCRELTNQIQENPVPPVHSSISTKTGGEIPDPTSAAQNNGILLVADQIDISTDPKRPEVVTEIQASGKVTYTDRVYDLTAGKIYFMPEKKRVVASEGVLIRQGESTLQTDQAELFANEPNYTLRSLSDEKIRIDLDPNTLDSSQ